MHYTQVERTRRYRETPRGQYTVHKANAKQRGIEFTLTFDQWWTLWQRSGKWAKRGNRKGCYVVCRKGDEGPYAQGNVFIGPFDQNLSDARRKAAARVKRKHTARSTTVTFPGTMADGRPVPPVTRATQSG